MIEAARNRAKQRNQYSTLVIFVKEKYRSLVWNVLAALQGRTQIRWPLVRKQTMADIRPISQNLQRLPGCEFPFSNFDFPPYNLRP
jgi:hypothetical protein